MPQKLTTTACFIFLDVTFDVSTGKYKPYRKPNDDPLYINKHSNHPPSILRQLPTSINKHAWHFCTRNCRFKMSRFFSQPCRIFWSLVTNLILEKFPKFIEKMLVRVFLYGDLRAIGRLRVSRGSK